jgi:hypothetical protein
VPGAVKGQTDHDLSQAFVKYFALWSFKCGFTSLLRTTLPITHFSCKAGAVKGQTDYAITFLRLLLNTLLCGHLNVALLHPLTF